MTGSSAIPQIGHAPGPGCRISGCIGQVHSATSPGDGAVATALDLVSVVILVILVIVMLLLVSAAR